MASIAMRIVTPRGFAPRTPLHAYSRAAPTAFVRARLGSVAWLVRCAHLHASTRTSGRCALLFGGLCDLAAGVVAAIAAHLVRELGLVALRTFAAADLLQGVVRAALGGAGLAVPPFWIRHD